MRSGTAKGTATDAAFREVVQLIQAARQRAAQVVNTEMIDLYWRLGEVLHHRIEADGWAKGTVAQLAAYIAQREPGRRGFSAQHRWQVREVARQIDSGLFERAVLNPPKLSTALRVLQPQADQHFKDAYLLEFLALPELHSEADLHRSLLQNLGRFLTELGRDFCCIGSEYPVQLGGQDFALDLLCFHRGLNCLVAIELKVTAFEPEHLGMLNFYLEALDRDAKKSHENPAIGVLLCASRDSEVVEYALSRTLSPALVAQYQTQLPDKQMLAAQLHEFYALNAPVATTAAKTRPSTVRTRKAGP